MGTRLSGVLARLTAFHPYGFDDFCVPFQFALDLLRELLGGIADHISARYVQALAHIRHFADCQEMLPATK